LQHDDLTAVHQAVDQLRDGDRFGIVHYGSQPMVHLEVTNVKGNREALHRAIDAIQIEGSTAMEAGLAKGYEVAEAELARSRGKTRMMLFTDENPNVGNTHATGFMAQARAGSHKGIGLTTIGVGVHFDAALATTLAEFGRVHALVNNAGIFKGADFLNISEADWDAVIDVNLKGHFLCGQAVAKQLVAQGGGGARLELLVLHDDATREFAYGPARGLPDVKLGFFTPALEEHAKKDGWTVVSMKDDWKKIFAFD